MWASTPTAQNGKRGDFSPDLYGFLRAFVGVKIETLYNNAHPPLRGGIPVWAVGWVDVGIDPYGAKSKPCTIMPIRPYGAESQFRGFANRQPIRSERVRQGPDALFCVIF